MIDLIFWFSAKDTQVHPVAKWFPFDYIMEGKVKKFDINSAILKRATANIFLIPPHPYIPSDKS